MTNLEIPQPLDYSFPRRRKDSFVCYYKGNLLLMSDLVDHCSFWFHALYSKIVMDPDVRILSCPYFPGLKYHNLKFLLMVLISDYCDYSKLKKPFPNLYLHTFNSLLPYSWLKYDEDFTEEELIAVAFAI